jgi:hypothetical protein
VKFVKNTCNIKQGTIPLLRFRIRFIGGGIRGRRGRDRWRGEVVNEVSTHNTYFSSHIRIDIIKYFLSYGLEGFVVILIKIRWYFVRTLFPFLTGS